MRFIHTLFLIFVFSFPTLATAQENWPYRFAVPYPAPDPADGILRFSPNAMLDDGSPEIGSFDAATCAENYEGCDKDNPYIGLFGNSRLKSVNNFRFHGGLDILARQGAPVFSISDGTASVYGLQFFGSQTVGIATVLCGMPMEIIYAHLDTAHVSDGDLVTAGDLIGDTGRNGTQFTNSSNIPTHLHLEFRPHSRGADFVDELKGLSANCGISRVRVGEKANLLTIDPWVFLSDHYEDYHYSLKDIGVDLLNFDFSDAAVLNAFYDETIFPFDQISYVGPVFDNKVPVSSLGAPTVDKFDPPILIDLEN